jgi:hypothetical protein
VQDETYRATLKQKAENLEFLNRCATKIQNLFKSYIIRKNFKDQLNRREEDLRFGVYNIVNNMRKKKWDEMLRSLKIQQMQNRKRVSVFGSFHREAQKLKQQAKQTATFSQYIRSLDARSKKEETLEFSRRRNKAQGLVSRLRT